MHSHRSIQLAFNNTHTLSKQCTSILSSVSINHNSVTEYMHILYQVQAEYLDTTTPLYMNYILLYGCNDHNTAVKEYPSGYC